MEIDLNLAEARMKLELSVDELIRYAAKGALQITVVADEWLVRTDKDSDEVIRGLVYLVPEDLLQGMTADHTVVRTIILPESGGRVSLVEPVSLPRGVLFIEAEEFRRFQLEYSDAQNKVMGTPPYMIKSDAYSEELAAAVDTWMALFASGDFDRQGKAVKLHIDEYLLKNHANLTPTTRKRIAIVVNPTNFKVGGPPPTPTQKT